MKKVLKIMLVLLSIVLTKLVIFFVINEIVIVNYNNNVYNSILLKPLHLFNFNQAYVVYYNEGNLLYKKGKYNAAIIKYQKALNNNPSKEKICDIRINLSLSMIKKIDSSNYEKAYKQLEEAKNNLYNNKCASEFDNSGYSKEAEKLEEEIKKLQDELKGFSDNPQPNNKNDNQPEDIDNYRNIEEELRNKEREANRNRQSDLDMYENLGDYTYYPGKRW